MYPKLFNEGEEFSRCCAWQMFHRSFMSMTMHSLDVEDVTIEDYDPLKWESYAEAGKFEIRVVAGDTERKRETIAKEKEIQPHTDKESLADIKGQLSGPT